MPELIPAATEAEWLEARRKGVTASEIAVLMGLSPYSSLYALYHQKLGILPQQDDSPEKRFGRFIEEYVAGEFAAAHPELMVTGTGRELFRHDDRPWQMATPDRVLADDMRLDFRDGTAIEEFEPVAVLECKTDGGSDEWGEPGTDEIPVHYRAQVLWQMDVMGVSTAYVACLRMMQRDVREYVIEMDDAARRDLALMVSHAKVFLADLEAGNAPDVDWRPATADALKRLHPSVVDEDWPISGQLANRYRAALRNYKHWERRKKLYEAQIRSRIGSARRATADGEVIARRDVYEVKAHERKASTVDKLVPVYPKKEKKNVSADSE